MGTELEKFREKLIEADVNVACNEIELDFEAIFLEGSKNLTSNPYSEYEWVVMAHSLVSTGRVIHAIPLISQCDDIPWEEWFLLDGKLHHNILYTKKHPQCDGEFPGSIDDKDHPKMVLGNKWYYYTDTNLLPLFFIDV